ncbi:hypothetical protein pb186bvf_016278 [Paramecium bursaria]
MQLFKKQQKKMGASCCQPSFEKPSEMINSNTQEGSNRQNSPRFGQEDSSTQIKLIQSKEKFNQEATSPKFPEDGSIEQEDHHFLEADMAELVELSGDNDQPQAPQSEKEIKNDKDLTKQRSIDNESNDSGKKSILKQELKYSQFRKLNTISHNKKVRFEY